MDFEGVRRCRHVQLPYLRAPARQVSGINIFGDTCGPGAGSGGHKPKIGSRCPHGNIFGYVAAAAASFDLRTVSLLPTGCRIDGRRRPTTMSLGNDCYAYAPLRASVDCMAGRGFIWV